MKTTLFIISLLILTTTRAAGPQDTTITFKVFGNCGMCKDRIEAAAKIKGVSAVSWSPDTKLIELTYNPAVANLDKIENRIVAAGHDLINKKAKDDVYKKLPDCCHYRETMIEEAQKQAQFHADDSLYIKGIVLDTDTKGMFMPLHGATIQWLNSSQGTTTDANGIFRIKPENGADKLVISYTGYTPDTLEIADQKELRIVLASGKQMKEVTVTAKQRSTYLSSLSTVRTQIITDKELFKAACCNLSESFETNPSVDVSYNDAVTGSKQIQLLGLSGAYTQLLVENLPGPRGLATPLGLNSIAGPWVESIQLTKGIGSVANGFESIAGQINVELKKPENSEKLFANVYVNSQGKTDLNLNQAWKLSKKWSTALLLHDDFLTNKMMDVNKDGFRDLPTGNQFALVNRWKFDNGNGWLSQFGVKILADDRTGGQTMFDKGMNMGTSVYGLGIKTNRYELFGKLGYVWPAKKYKSVGLQLSAIDHKHDSYFGNTVYNGEQKNFYANLIYQSIIHSTIHKFRLGASFVYDHYNEIFAPQMMNALSFNRRETVPGVFGEYTFTPNTKFSAIAGLRADYDNIYGFFMTPRLHLRYEPVHGTTFRISAGRGQRTANVLAENMSSMVSTREFEFENPQAGKAYGMDAEVSWNKGISLDQKLKLFHREATLSLDYFRNDFTSQVMADPMHADMLMIYNIRGKSFSNSFQAELSSEPVKNLELRLAYRYFDVMQTYQDGITRPKPLLSPHRAFGSVDYTHKGWKFDYTVSFNGHKPVPPTPTNIPGVYAATTSPVYWLMNAQVSKTVGQRHPFDIYLGGENLTNFYQKNAIIGASHPFVSPFDASLIWGPVSGRMGYVGMRYKIK